MRTRRRPRPAPGNRRSGVALLLSVLVLIVVIAIVFQIQITTMTTARVARNDVGLTGMDLAIESSSLEVFEQLAADGGAPAAGGGAPGGGGIPGAPPADGDPSGGGSGGAGGGEAPPSDSKQDEWARPQRSEVNGIQLRILVQDEESKYNVLNLLAADEDEAEAALERVKRILDQCREGTREDISSAQAEDMARAMRDYMKERDRYQRPRPKLLTEVEDEPNRVLPLSLREFLTLEPFEERHFRDYRDADGAIVHSIGSFLTIWTSPAVASDLANTNSNGGAGAPGGGAPGAGGNSNGGAPGQGGNRGGGSGAGSPSGNGSPQGGGGSGGGSGSGSGNDAGAGGGAPGQGAPNGQGGSSGASGASSGYGVNLNTAPPVVLKSLFDDREISSRFWDDVIEYRNLEEEKDDDAQSSTSQAEAVYDEYGREIVPRKFFDTLDELSEVESWNDFDGQEQEKVRAMLGTQSQVFSIFITARRSTAADEGALESLTGADREREEEEAANALVRTVRMVVWRRAGSEQAQIVPIVPWEVLDYMPFEVLDYPDERR